MLQKYISRSMEELIQRVLKGFPAMILTGPRQSGKTTMLRHALQSTHRYVSLEDFEYRDLAIKDPKAFLDRFPPPVIYDEIQYAPRLMSGIKYLIDESRDVNGQYILTGSQNLMLLEKVTESLAGRVAILNLLPFSQAELTGQSAHRLPWERNVRDFPLSSGESLQQIASRIIAGGFPGALAHPEPPADLWFAGYIQSYIERDVHQVRNIHDQPLFRRFLRLLATRSGQMVNHASLGHDLGLSAATVREWLSVLIVTGHVVLLAPYYANIGKSLVKSCKLYFTDTGLLSYLLGIRNSEQLSDHPMAGAIFETAVFAELYKSFLNRGIEPRIYFWRTREGAEIDFIIEEGGRLIPIEAKFTSTPDHHDARFLKRFRQDFPKAAPGWVIHAGERMGPMGEGNWGVPFGEV